MDSGRHREIDIVVVTMYNAMQSDRYGLNKHQ
jgi:hypothetical protein